MCGICGFIGLKDEKLIRQMTNILSHRGPDSEGYHIEEEISLGVRRLAIIDLVSGNQPIYNEDKSIVVVLNGEIYNFKLLREMLQQKNHKFYTNSDTEVIVHLYEEYKENFLQYLCGMFAFALWDKNKKQLLIARDRLGIKPLFYSKIDNKLFFASEIKSLLQCPQIQKEINLNSIDNYFSFLYIPYPETVYKNIFQLPPAHLLIYKDKQIKIERYWELKFLGPIINNEKVFVEKFESLMQTVCDQHLISDVPVGIFLSGGYDSTTITTFVSKSPFSNKTKVFTISHPYSLFDETKKAKIVAERLNIPYTFLTVSAESINIEELIEKIVTGFDQPFADSSSVLTYLIANVSRNYCKVVLSGIGGDELFYGYPRYQGIKLSCLFPKINIPEELINAIPESYSPDNTAGRIKRFLTSLHYPIFYRYLSYITFTNPEDKKNFYTKEFYSYLDSTLQNRWKTEHFDNCDSKYLEDKIMNIDINTYLVDDLLAMADRMGMLNSLEIRVPFCDHRVVELVSRISPLLRWKGYELKYLLKKILSKYMPKEIVQQKKMGFMLPLAEWFTKGELKNKIEKFIQDKEYEEYFNYQFIEKMWELHLSKKRCYHDQLWSLLVFDKWKKIYNIELPKLKERYKTLKKEKLKILMVSDFIFEDEEGGSGRMVSEISNELSRRGHKVFNLTLHRKGLPLYEEKNFRQIFRCRVYLSDLLKSLFVTPNDVEEVIKFSLENINFDIVNYHHPFSGFLIKNVKKIKNVPQIYSFHSPWHVEYEIRAKSKNLPKVVTWINSYIRKEIEDKVIKDCQKVVVLSEYTKRLVKEYHKIPEEKIVLISGGVDVDKFSPAEDVTFIRKKLGLPINKKILLTVRNLVPRMGLENLLLAFKDILKEDKDLFLIICGSGELEKKLKLITNELGLDNFVKFTGYVPDDILVMYYQSADLFVLPTKELEGFGLVTIEALSCGLPVLGTPVGGTVEILSQFGLLFDDNTAESMAKKIKGFIKMDKEKVNMLKKKCRQYVVENFSWKKVVDKIEDLFLTLVKR